MTSDVRAALEAGDDGFHEIQLNGKQLVFLGMATTLVSVVIFLCGVLVGRGVKPLDTVAQAGEPHAFDVQAAAPVAPGAVAAPPPSPTPSPVAGVAGAGAAVEPAGDTEPTPQGDEAEDELAAPAPAPEPPPPAAVAPKVETPKRATAEVKPAPKPEPARAAVTPAPATPPVMPAATAPAATPVPEPAAVATSAPSASGRTHAVQVGAFKTRGEADALARRLSGRGYAVYVMNPTGDGKAVYRVRVGNYASADEAQRVSAKLTQQEKLKPWITR